MLGNLPLLNTGGRFYKYQIANSVWLDGSADYLDRTWPADGDRQKWTLSWWQKMVNPDQLQTVLAVKNATGGNQHGFIRFASNLFQFEIGEPGNSAHYMVQSTRKFRDPVAWFHFVVEFDSTQAGSLDRVKLYCNGEAVTLAWNTSVMPQNYASGYINSALAAHQIGRTGPTSPGEYLPAYLAEIHFLDGIATDATAFGELKEGVWVPKEYAGVYGTNGFYLDFANSVDLGADNSGNGNNWTPNSLSSDNHSTDSATNNQVVLNYLRADATVKPSLGGRQHLATTNDRGNISTLAIPATGKWVAEFTCDALPATFTVNVGVADADVVLNTTRGGTLSANAWTYLASNGNKNVAGSLSTYGDTWTVGDVIRVEVDRDAGSLEFFKNGASQGVATSALPADIDLFFIVGTGGGTSSVGGTWAFNPNEFVGTPTAGFKALRAANLPEPPKDSFPYTKCLETVLYTGNGTTQDITGLAFQPGLVWIKKRNTTANHRLMDAARGVHLALSTDIANAEFNETDGLTAYNADGFSLGSNVGYNQSGHTYGAWCIKLGTAFSGTTTGAGVGQAYSGEYGLEAGVAAISYTGNGTAGHTIPLPSAMTDTYGAPKMVIVKDRGAANSWAVWHADLTSAGYALALDTNAAQASDGTVWNSTAPSASAVTLGTSARTNASGNNYIMLVFWEVPGFSKGFTYEGNNSADGAYVNLGFRPGWILTKNIDALGSWCLHDNERAGYNDDNDALFPDLNSAESTALRLDLLSNGAKMRVTGNEMNASTLVGWAFAEQPGKYALAR